MNNFYEKLLDIKKFDKQIKYNNDLEFIKKLIINYLTEFKDADVTGYCMGVQTELTNILKNNNFDCMLFNTGVIIPKKVHSHYFSIVNIDNKKYLLDPTYKQFFGNTKFTKESNKFVENKFKNDILHNGIIEIDDNKLNEYINSFYKTNNGIQDNITFINILPKQIITNNRKIM